MSDSPFINKPKCCPTCGGPLPLSKLGLAMAGNSITRDGQRIDLTRLEAIIVWKLATHAPWSVTLNSLIYEVWQGNDEPSDAEGAFYAHICKLKKKIEPLGLHITSKRHCGYKLEALSAGEPS